MCDVFNNFPLYLLLGCQSALQEIPISNPVPRGAFTLAQESRRMKDGGEKKERSLVGWRLPHIGNWVVLSPFISRVRLLLSFLSNLMWNTNYSTFSLCLNTSAAKGLSKGILCYCKIFANLRLKLYYTGRQSVLASLHLHRSPYPHNQSQRQETTPTAFPIAFNNSGCPQDIK